ncbi:hypothetical protein F2Q68_00031242 [Brassica cretica]|uniref:Uncharacterized protein n=1 Tax=Brassica cretica TaxID=69181 RepID=A0A8S9G7K9_BRACR|nr:hypothetical protein F2Q68_00031242 [Brassica cretica]
MKQDLAMLQKQHGVSAGRSTSIDTHTQTSIDAMLASIDGMLASIDAHLAPFEDRKQSFTYRHDGVYYPLQPSPSIDGDHTTRRSELVTKKSLQDKLDEITFSQDLLKEDVYQELKDISETTHARLGMQQRNIGNLQHRMHATEVTRERLKNQWTRGDEAIRSFTGAWYQMSRDEVDTYIQPSGHFDHY